MGKVSKKLPHSEPERREFTQTGAQVYQLTDFSGQIEMDFSDPSPETPRIADQLTDMESLEPETPFFPGFDVGDFSFEPQSSPPETGTQVAFFRKDGRPIRWTEIQAPNKTPRGPHRNADKRPLKLQISLQFLRQNILALLGAAIFVSIFVTILRDWLEN